jgi:membrane-bound lytic murein transglycosylase
MLMLQSILIIILMVFSIITQASLPADPIQRCLDVRRLADFTTRQKITAKEPGVLRFKFHKITASELPRGNPVGNMKEIIQALNIQIKNCQANGEFQSVTIGGHKFARQEWCLNTNKKMLALAKSAHGDFKKYLEDIKTEFDWYKSEGWPENHAGYKKGQFQFTAYYAPTAIEARTNRKGPFLHPIYKNPGVVHAGLESKKFNLTPPLCGVDPLTKIARGFCVKNAPGQYSVVPDREEIHHGALNPKYVIGYVKDPNDPDFLMLQGAGSLFLDGKVIHVNYDGSNGRPRTMLGRIVQCAQDPTCGGNLDNMERCAKDPKCHDEEKLRCKVSKTIKTSAATEKLIRQYLNRLNPVKATDLRNRDQSFVFFMVADEGPFGSEDIPLTPHASCATDHKVIPVGMNFIYNFNTFTSWCVAQDAGGAIMGAHVDLYTGEGHQAGVEANKVNHSGTLFVALPKHGTH